VSGHDFSRADWPHLALGFSPCELSLLQVHGSKRVLLQRVCQTSFYRIVFDVLLMLLKTPLIDDAHVGKSPLPNLSPKPQLPVGPKRKAAFDQLHRFLKAHLAGNGHQDVNVIGHHDKVVNHNSFGPHG
jgi:hypothetical protein